MSRSGCRFHPAALGASTIPEPPPLPESPLSYQPVGSAHREQRFRTVPTMGPDVENQQENRTAMTRMPFTSSTGGCRYS